MPQPIAYKTALLVILAALLLVSSLSFGEAITRNRGNYEGTIVTTKDLTYVSTLTFFYIGKTDNYTLMYDKEAEATTIIPNSEVTKIVISKKYKALPKSEKFVSWQCKSQ